MPEQLVSTPREATSIVLPPNVLAGLVGLDLNLAPYAQNEALMPLMSRHANDAPALVDMSDVVKNNTLRGVDITEPFGRAVTVGAICSKAVRLLEIYDTDPSTALTVVERRVAGFHGARSGGMFDVLESGLMSDQGLRKTDVVPVGGSRIFGGEEGHSDIAFADWRSPESVSRYTADQERLTPAEITSQISKLTDDASVSEKTYGRDNYYATQFRAKAAGLAKLKAKLDTMGNGVKKELIVDNFPVAYGISPDDFAVVETVYDLDGAAQNKEASGDVPTLVRRVDSDVEGEFVLVNGACKPEQIRAIAVPKEQIDHVSLILHEHFAGLDIAVIPLEPLQQP